MCLSEAQQLVLQAGQRAGVEPERLNDELKAAPEYQVKLLRITSLSVPEKVQSKTTQMP